jgi:hypothetical protein
MNANLRRTLIALAVLSVFTVSAAYAGQDQGGSGGTSTSVKITKKVSLTSNVNVNGNVDVSGNIDINAAAVALSSATQDGSNNQVYNHHDVSNTATIGGNVGQTATGNIGVNQASGDFNAQGNSAAIAAGAAASTTNNDADFTFDGCGGGGGWSADGCKDPGGSSSAGGMADAETFANQKSDNTKTDNHGTTDTAKVSGSAFQGDSGNIGVNQAAGNGNEQLNQLAAATTSDNVYALATSTLDQEWSGNSVKNDPGTLGWCSPEMATTNSATLSGSVAAEASGNIGLNQAAGTGNLQSNSLSLAAADPNSK